MDKGKIIKVKCLKCGHEEYQIIEPCTCLEHCSCEKEMCSVCGALTLPIENWENGIISLIEMHLVELYQVDSKFNIVDCVQNRKIKEALTYINMIRENLLVNMNQE